jgi:hypothetical protein
MKMKYNETVYELDCDGERIRVSNYFDNGDSITAPTYKTQAVIIVISLIEEN